MVDFAAANEAIGDDKDRFKFDVKESAELPGFTTIPCDLSEDPLVPCPHCKLESELLNETPANNVHKATCPHCGWEFEYILLLSATLLVYPGLDIA